MAPETHTDELTRLLSLLPQALQDAVKQLPMEELLEVVMDIGRLPQARLPGRAVRLSDYPVSREEIDHVVAAVGEFGADNRAGIEGTLHRISAIRNRRGEIIGLTLRIGRAVFGTIDLIRDLIEQGRSVLMLGRPGVGKTTKLREIARVLADDFNKRVIVIDTSNEIGGDGDVPHPAIGSARRMQVPHPERQHAVMIEAVENHMPEVIIVDEIGTEAEALAARTIAERGVQLIGTAHGNTLENLVMNPTLSDLVGGTETVVLSDEEARMRRTQKTVTERKAPPTFDAVVEIVERDEVVIHFDTARAVDELLRGREPAGIRRTPQGETEVAPEPPAAEAAVSPPAEEEKEQRPARIYAYAVSRDAVERTLRSLHLEARTVKLPEQADFIIALRSRVDDPRLLRIVEATGAPVHVVKKSSTAQIRRLLQNVFNVMPGMDQEEVSAAVSEAEAAVKRVLQEGVEVALPPRSSTLRRLQHRIVTRNHLVSTSEGSEPERHLVIHPFGKG